VTKVHTDTLPHFQHWLRFWVHLRARILATPTNLMKHFSNMLLAPPPHPERCYLPSEFDIWSPCSVYYRPTFPRNEKLLSLLSLLCVMFAERRQKSIKSQKNTRKQWQVASTCEATENEGFGERTIICPRT